MKQEKKAYASTKTVKEMKDWFTKFLPDEIVFNNATESDMKQKLAANEDNDDYEKDEAEEEKVRYNQEPAGRYIEIKLDHQAGESKNMYQKSAVWTHEAEETR